MNATVSRNTVLLVLTALLSMWMAPAQVASGVQRNRSEARAAANTSVSRPAARRGGNTTHSGNRNVNVNSNVNRNVHVDVDNHHDHWNDWDDHYHPIATAAAVTATVALTSAVIGSMINTVPVGCRTTIINGIAYQECGSTWYEPRYYGTNVQYIVVMSPR